MTHPTIYRGSSQVLLSQLCTYCNKQTPWWHSANCTRLLASKIPLTWKQSLLSRVTNQADFTKISPTCILPYKRIQHAWPCIHKHPWHVQSHPPPHFVQSDHVSLFLLPANKQQLKRKPPTQRIVRHWTEEADSMLQDCFENTDWNMFKDSSTQDSSINIEEYTLSVQNIGCNSF